MFVLKFLLYFSLSFFILTIPFSGHPLFYSLEEFARPVTQKVFSYVKETSKEGLKKGTEATSKLFSNTIPPKKDKVTVKRSSRKKEVKPMGKYTPEEQEFLENILKKAQ